MKTIYKMMTMLLAIGLGGMLYWSDDWTSMEPIIVPDWYRYGLGLVGVIVIVLTVVVYGRERR